MNKDYYIVTYNVPKLQWKSRNRQGCHKTTDYYWYSIYPNVLDTDYYRYSIYPNVLDTGFYDLSYETDDNYVILQKYATITELKKVAENHYIECITGGLISGTNYTIQ